MISALTRLADWSARTPKRLWLIAFALFFALTGSWSAASPIGSSPDEHAHFIRAAAVARGQIGGTQVMVTHTVAGRNSTAVSSVRPCIGPSGACFFTRP